MTTNVRTGIASLILILGICTSSDGRAGKQVKRDGDRPTPNRHSKASMSGDGHLMMTSLQIRPGILVQILNHADVQELRPEPNNPSSELRLRLFVVPKEGDCVLDSHYVCSHHYYLAVSAYEEGLGETVYDLGEVGEIDNIQWLRTDKPLTVRLRTTATNYPRDRFKDNGSLIKKERTYELDVRVDRLLVRSLK